jgi:hypothetical protein
MNFYSQLLFTILLSFKRISGQQFKSMDNFFKDLIEQTTVLIMLVMNEDDIDFETQILYNNSMNDDSLVKKFDFVSFMNLFQNEIQ